MKLKPTYLLWHPPTGRKYHRVGKAGTGLYYSYCGLMLPNDNPEIDIAMIDDYLGDLICKRCQKAFDKT